MRWRLTTGHYLNVPGTEWEQRETNRETGKQARRVYSVPLLLDPRDPADHNYPGEIVVAYEGKGQGRDIIFVGEPTPDMEPLDDEAQALSDSLRSKWNHPIDSLDGGYATDIFQKLERQLSTLLAKAQPVAIPADTVSKADFDALKAQLEELKAQVAQPAQVARRA
jgi:polyhydroxyalkanoate synthesis regulator phasin